MGNEASIKRQRAYEADRKADIKKGAEQAEKCILFLVDGTGNGSMGDLEDATFSTLKGARDRLQEQNQKLAADVGEELMRCAPESHALVEQIINYSLREMQQSNSNKPTRNRRKKKSAFSKLKGERDRLQKQNQKLAADVGEEPMLCADTEGLSALAKQIKDLKDKNDRLHEKQQSNGSKPNQKKKAYGSRQQ